jgi:methionyl-tRNA formyltransferase
MSAPVRLVFLGSDPIALPLLNWFSSDAGSQVAQVIAVFTQPDRPVGRGQKIAANAIKSWALERRITVYQPEKLTDDVRVHYAMLGADVALVMAYGHILRENFIETPRLGTFNLHASILPKYRGASPIQSAIANGESETGVAFMRMVLRLDAGPVADVERVPIAPLDTAADVEAKLASACVPLLERVMPKVCDGSLVFVPQEETEATFCRRLTKDDGALDFTASAATLAARINGLFPWPGCSVEINGHLVKFGLAEAGRVSAPSLSTREAGTVVGHDSDGLSIATGAGILRVRRLQRPGGKMLAADEFMRGFPIVAGTKLPSRPMSQLVAPAPFRK